MKKINWKVRIYNLDFWLTLIPALFLLVQTVAAIFGFTLDLGDLDKRVLAAVNAVFAVMAILGVVNDPTTQSLGDSKQAMTYDTPKKD